MKVPDGTGWQLDGGSIEGHGAGLRQHAPTDLGRATHGDRCARHHSPFNLTGRSQGDGGAHEPEDILGLRPSDQLDFHAGLQC